MLKSMERTKKRTLFFIAMLALLGVCAYLTHRYISRIPAEVIRAEQNAVATTSQFYVHVSIGAGEFYSYYVVNENGYYDPGVASLFGPEPQPPSRQLSQEEIGDIKDLVRDTHIIGLQYEGCNSGAGGLCKDATVALDGKWTKFSCYSSELEKTREARLCERFISDLGDIVHKK